MSKETENQEAETTTEIRNRFSNEILMSLPVSSLVGANLRGADLYGADLRGAKINWQSHAVIAEILRQAAGEDYEKRMAAGLILVSPDWCWDRFLKIELPQKEWALETLTSYVTDGDEAPSVLLARVKKEAAVSGG